MSIIAANVHHRFLTTGQRAMAVAARKAKLSLDAQNDWAEYKLDTERKAGQMLKDLPRHRGGRPPKNPSDDQSTYGASGVSHGDPPKLADIGISYGQASTWQRLADLPDDEYEGYKATARAKGKEITETGAVRIAKHREREQAKKEQALRFAQVTEEKS